MEKKNKKVFVSGCFDPLHAGHITFFETASQYGDLFVSVGSDKNIEKLKNRLPYLSEKERLYCVKAIESVKDAFIANGSGMLDFLPELEKIKPNFFVVNKDGHTKEKEDLCKKLNIEYIVLDRLPKPGLPARSSTQIRNDTKMPYRIDLAGGWLDQPYVSKYCSGSVITISVEATQNFNERSGMGTSTRNKAIELWGHKLPAETELSAKTLFGYENLPGKKEISGSQDAIGIIFSGLNKLDYQKNKYWPQKIENVIDDNLLNWLENLIYLIPLGPRPKNLNILDKFFPSKTYAEKLSKASKNCFSAIIKKDKIKFGKAITDGFNAQVSMFPKMINPKILKTIQKYKNNVLGYKISGAGGGGYIILVSDKNIENAIKIKIRRKTF